MKLSHNLRFPGAYQFVSGCVSGLANGLHWTLFWLIPVGVAVIGCPAPSPHYNAEVQLSTPSSPRVSVQCNPQSMQPQ